MKRAFMFLLVGPALVVLTIWFAVGMPIGDFVFFIAVWLFVCTLPVSAAMGILDGVLAQALPILTRAPLMVVVGAIVAAGLPVAVLGPLPQDLSLPLAIGGALCMGACSLLAHDYPSRKTKPADTGSPS